MPTKYTISVCFIICDWSMINKARGNLQNIIYTVLWYFQFPQVLKLLSTCIDKPSMKGFIKIHIHRRRLRPWSCSFSLALCCPFLSHWVSVLSLPFYLAALQYLRSILKKNVCDLSCCYSCMYDTGMYHDVMHACLTPRTHIYITIISLLYHPTKAQQSNILFFVGE